MPETTQQRIQRVRQQMQSSSGTGTSTSTETTQQRIQRIRSEMQTERGGVTPPQQQPSQLSGFDRALQVGAGVTDAIFGGGKVGEAIGTQAAKMGLTGLSPEERQYVSKGPTAGEIAGSAAQSALLFTPVGKLAGAVTKGLSKLGVPAAQTLGRVGTGAGLGYAYDVASGMERGESVGDTLTPGLGTIIGGAIPGGSAVLSKIPSALRKSAQKDYEKVLYPTTRQNKQTTQKLVPELARRRVTAASDEALLEQAEKGSTRALERLDDVYASLPQDAKVNLRPVFLNITKEKNKLLNQSGVLPASNQPKWETLDALERELANIANRGGGSIATIRQYRGQLDEVINEAGKGFGFDAAGKASLKAQRIMANTLRSELAKQFPDTAKFNRDYTFWKRVTDVLEAKGERKTGQQGFLRTLGTLTGGGTGFATGGPGGAIVGAVAVRTLMDFMKSTLWRTLSASQKSRMSDLLSQKKYPELIKLLQDSGATIKVVAPLSEEAF